MGFQRSTIGNPNNLAADRDLFLRKFSGEVITQFENQNQLLNKFRVRTINSGKSATFPVVGFAEASYHTLGEDILVDQNDKSVAADYLKNILVNEKEIFVDQTLVAPTFVANWEEMVNHWDVRQPFAKALAEALSSQLDRHLYRVAIQAARTSATISNTWGGTSGVAGPLVNANLLTTAATIQAAIFEAAKVLDEKMVPKEGRYAFLRPQQYYNLVSAGTLVDKDTNDSNGSISGGIVYSCAGIQLVKTMAWAPSRYTATAVDEITTNVYPQDSNAGIHNDLTANNGYALDMTTHAGLVCQTDAVGTVKMQDLTMESEYLIWRQGTLMVAKYIMGHGVLRPECAVELKLS